MKKLLSTIISVLFCVLAFAQNKEVMYVSVIGEEIAEPNKHIIEDLFHDMLKDNYEIRLDQGNGLFSKELYKELQYQELGAVCEDEIKRFGLQKGADLLCVVIIESFKDGKRQYYFRTKIYDVETATLNRSANYPHFGFDDQQITRINDIEELQMVSSELIKRLGFKVTNRINSNIRKNKSALKPSDKGGNMRLYSSFSNLGELGLAFYFHKSYFQIGADFVFSFPTDSDHPEEDKLILLNELGNAHINNVKNYTNPILQFTVSPGLNFNYISVECGLGIFSSNDITMVYANSNYPDQTITNNTYFLVRPTITGYIPSDGMGVSLSIGYNIVPDATQLNGLLFGVGFTL